MRKNIVFLLTMLLSFIAAYLCHAQEHYVVPKIEITPILDGTIDTMENMFVWGRVNSRPIRFFLKAENEDEWLWSNHWPDITQGYSQDNIWVYWKAFWYEDTLYFFITMEDDVLDCDNRRGNSANLDEDDSIQLWLSEIWEGPPPDFFEENYLFHNDFADSFFTQHRDGTFDSIYVNESDSKINFGKTINGTTWFIEAAIAREAGYQFKYQVGETLWLNMSYKDADGETIIPGSDFSTHWLTLAWNGWSYATPSLTPGKLVLGGIPPFKEEEIYEEAARFNGMAIDSRSKFQNTLQFNLDGVLDEAGYQHANPIILTSYRTPNSSDSLNYDFWQRPSDAAVIFRGFWVPDSGNTGELYLGFEIYDDERDSTNLASNPVQDDGLLLWIDFDRDSAYNVSANDVNILIHNSGSIFQYDTSSYENFDSSYTQSTIQAQIGDLKKPGNWVAEVKIQLPANYFSKNSDNIIRIEIGYNDADAGARQHQLLWNNTRSGVAVWRDFSALGSLKLVRGAPRIDWNPPTAPGKPEAAAPFIADTLVAFSWQRARDYSSGIGSYHLQADTTPGGNDLMDKWIGKVLTHTIHAAPGQCIYVRVQAQDRAGNIGPWSPSSDGVTVDMTPPSAPGIPGIDNSHPDSVTFSWSPASDAESGILDYFLQAGTALGDSNVFNNWIDGNDTSLTIPWSNDQTLFARVRAKNGAKLLGEWSGYQLRSRGDVIFVFELSQNMAASLAEMKQAAVAMMTDLSGSPAALRFAIGSFIDYPGSYRFDGYAARYGAEGDYAWQLDQPFTDDEALLSDRIAKLSLHDGGDGPQAYARSLLECLLLDWRTDARKIVVMIGASPAHDADFFSANYGADPGPDAQPDSWDDLDYQQAVDWMRRAGLTIIALDNGTATDSTADFEGDTWKNFEYLAAKTGGSHVMKQDWQEASTLLQNLIAEGPLPDSLYPWVSEAENMFHRIPWYGNPCPSGWRLTHSDQPIYSGVVIRRDTLYRVKIRARAEIGNNIAPWLLIRIGDGLKGTLEITGADWQDYEFVAPLRSGFQQLSLTFLNDWWIPGTGDRNLLLDNVTLDYGEAGVDSVAYVFEAENMSHHSPGSSRVGEYWLLDKKYANIAHDFYFETHHLDCSIIARADSAAQGWPRMDVRMDGRIVTSFLVDSQEDREYRFTLTAIASGRHRIAIAYNNQNFRHGRKLYIDKLILQVKDGGLLKPAKGKPGETEQNRILPEHYALDQNRPNPFNPTTEIKYQLPRAGHVSIKIFNMLGQEIVTLVDGEQGAGYYSASWNGLDHNGSPVGSGIYLYRLQSGDYVCTKKLILLR